MEVLVLNSAAAAAVTDKRKLLVIGGFSGFLVILLSFTATTTTTTTSTNTTTLPTTTSTSTSFFFSTSSRLPAVNVSRTVADPMVGLVIGMNTSGGSGDDFTVLSDSMSNSTINYDQEEPITTSTQLLQGEEEKENNKKKKKKYKCNIYEGRWVYKPSKSGTAPMYRSDQCPFLENVSTCRRNGRPDAAYEGWIWEPYHCYLPSFDGKDMLERLRGKRMIIAGDSLNRDQWLSLACLIYTSISHPSTRTLVEAQDPSYKLLKALDYDFTLEFYWSPLLVDLDDGLNKNKHINITAKRVLHLDRMVPSSDRWRGADVMVFNSGYWWNHGLQIRAWDVFEYKGRLVDEMPKELAYQRGLATWSTWLSNNVDPNKTTVFFRSISAEHKGKHWCFNATQPLDRDSVSSYVNTFPRSLIQVAETHIASANSANLFPVRYLNITGLSRYRRDAHPSLYGQPQSKWKALLKGPTDDQTNNHNTIVHLAKQQADCSHWCLPGVPDTWNSLLYASLFFSFD